MLEITINTLKDLWKADKEFYRTAEVGSGVQKFCNKVFHCSMLFNLKEGTGSTKEIKRKNEFLEEAKKKGRRADVVIFIDSDIIIPVEVEKHGNIKAGLRQIYNYQADWVKKYGILTDGNEWRFYNNTIVVRTFFIDKVLENPTDFLTFWNEYITPEYYYLSFFEKKGQLRLFEEYIPPLDEVREDFFIDISKLIENFGNKLNLKGYFKEVNDETEREKKAVEITYAYLIQFILYKTLVDNSFADFEEDWKQRLKAIDKALHSESYGEILQRIQGISKKISQNIYKRFSDEQEVINTHLEGILSKPKNEIGDVSVWLDILQFINRYNFNNVQNEIFGYVYENYLKDLYLDEKKGQYFTDPLVVDFMLEQIGYTSENLKMRYTINKDSISIIDPSCGSGTFLYNATNRIVESFFDDNKKSSELSEKLVNENIFGLDIAEFPLYLAEMNILMRMLPLVINQKYNNPIDQKIKVFKTRDSIAEFLDTSIRWGNTKTDSTTKLKKNLGQMSLFTGESDLGYDSFVRDKQDLDSLKSSLESHNKIPRHRFDFVIGNPPYVGYNECSSQGLLFIKHIQSKKLLASDIYGVNLNTVPGRIKAYSPKPNLYSFFIALGIGLLKDYGKICYIIPQTILTSTDHDVIRYHLAKFTTIDKIITFSGKMFVGRGIKQDKPIPTSSLIFIVSKLPPKKLHQVEIVNYSEPADDIHKCLLNLRKGISIFKTKISQEVLLRNAENWNFIKFSKEDEEVFKLYYSGNTYDIYRLDTFSKKYFGDEFYFDKGLIYPKDKITQNIPSDSYYQLIKTNQKGFSIATTDSFIPRKVISLPGGAQGFKVYNAKYKIIWRYMNTENFMYTDKDVMINHNWILISSDNKREIFYIFSLLNSTITKFILWKLLSNENEKSFQVGIKIIKEFCRVPIISDSYKIIKEEIIYQAENLLSLENSTFADHIDFKCILQQKFDSVEVKGDYLVIRHKTNYAKCKITGNASLVQQTLNENLSALTDENGIGRISDLRNLSVIDFEQQNQIKNYIDDLVFALYFKVNLSSSEFSNFIKVHEVVSKHKYYLLINQNSNA
ncbi:MAG TPA: N-6 DNA methylase [Bacteroidales bacterium]|nr:N-6 DNA methylase [Bacteroidales bacterium]